MSVAEGVEIIMISINKMVHLKWFCVLLIHEGVTSVLLIQLLLAFSLVNVWTQVGHLESFATEALPDRGLANIPQSPLQRKGHLSQALPRRRLHNRARQFF